MFQYQYLSNFNCRQALKEPVLRTIAPSIFAIQPVADVSELYVSADRNHSRGPQKQRMARPLDNLRNVALSATDNILLDRVQEPNPTIGAFPERGRSKASMRIYDSTRRFGTLRRFSESTKKTDRIGGRVYVHTPSCPPKDNLWTLN